MTTVTPTSIPVNTGPISDSGGSIVAECIPGVVVSLGFDTIQPQATSVITAGSLYRPDGLRLTGVWLAPVPTATTVLWGARSGPVRPRAGWHSLPFVVHAGQVWNPVFVMVRTGSASGHAAAQQLRYTSADETYLWRSRVSITAKRVDSCVRGA